MKDYPYQKEFDLYCKVQKHYADSTMLVVRKSVAIFWKYYVANSNVEATINHVKSSDIQDFLNGLETKLGLKKNTINKYISHLKVYFTFLYTHHLIDSYPVVEINGRKFNRMHHYLINWMDKLPQIAQLDGIHPVTVKMMVGIALGYLPNEVLRLRYSDVIEQIKDSSLRQYIMKNVNFGISKDPYLLGKKFGGYYSSDYHLAQSVKADRKIIGMDITLQDLRLSYVYSILSEKDLTDEELERKLRVNDKTLFYYRQNMRSYNILTEFKLPKWNCSGSPEQFFILSFAYKQ